jgi:phage host-nuclease inhibitor protein Gam
MNRLREWAIENEMVTNPGKSKAVNLTTARVKERIRYYFGYQLIPEASSLNI